MPEIQQNNQYTPGNGYDGHYWAGGYRGGDGQYRWDSGAVFEFNDFVGNPGEDPYLHLTPGNNYQWNTKNDQDDTNNGCLCKSQEPTYETERSSICPVGWYSVGEKYTRWTIINKMVWTDAYDYCQHIGAELITWRTEGEWLTLKFFMLELFQENCLDIENPYCNSAGLATWTGANIPPWYIEEYPWRDFFFNNNTMDFVPMDYAWAPGSPGEIGPDHGGRCVKFFHDGVMRDFYCDNYDVAPMCQAV